MRQEQALIWQIRPTSHLLLLTTATADEQDEAAGDNDTREAAAAADDTSRLRRGSCSAAPSTLPLSAVSRSYWHCRNYDYNIDYVTVGCPSVCLSVPSIDIFPLPQPGRGQQISIDSCRRPRLRVASRRRRQQQQQQQQNNTNNSIITIAIEG